MSPLRQRRSPGVLLRCGEPRTTNGQSSFTTTRVLHSWITRLVGWSCAKSGELLLEGWSVGNDNVIVTGRRLAGQLRVVAVLGKLT